VKSSALPSVERLALCLVLAWSGVQAAEAPAEPTPAWAAPRPALDTTLRVVELPAGSPLPRSRKHHALTWHNDALTRALGNNGLAGADCHNRVRLPTRVHTVPGTGRTAQVQLQLAIGCSF
jgi:hypothetical protein